MFGSNFAYFLLGVITAMIIDAISGFIIYRKFIVPRFQDEVKQNEIEHEQYMKEEEDFHFHT
jgi:hypothetical protein